MLVGGSGIKGGKVEPSLFCLTPIFSRSLCGIESFVTMRGNSIRELFFELGAKSGRFRKSP